MPYSRVRYLCTWYHAYTKQTNFSPEVVLSTAIIHFHGVASYPQGNLCFCWHYGKYFHSFCYGEVHRIGDFTFCTGHMLSDDYSPTAYISPETFNVK